MGAFTVSPVLRQTFEAYQTVRSELPQFFRTTRAAPPDIAAFDRLLVGDITAVEAANILSGGYVVHMLEASIWCLLTTESFREAVVTAVNLGEDTDTTSSMSGFADIECRIRVDPPGASSDGVSTASPPGYRPCIARFPVERWPIVEA
jgi:hypothetical protein